jgi:hypothetical protein
MAQSVLIPMFPLTLLPLPGELIPLHIFEPRYKQLLTEAETLDIHFGIYCNHEFNTLKLGSLMKLESVLKRYPTGESDIIVKCLDVFEMSKLYRTYKTKLYPGGDVDFHHVNLQEIPHVELYELFLEYQNKRNITKHTSAFNIYQIAQELNLDLHDRYKFLSASAEKREGFIMSQLKYQIHILQQEENSKHSFYLN